jgi:hypothetical protein
VCVVDLGTVDWGLDLCVSCGCGSPVFLVLQRKGVYPFAPLQFCYWLGCVSPGSVIMKPYPLCSVIPVSVMFDHIFMFCRVGFLYIVACVRV